MAHEWERDADGQPVVYDELPGEGFHWPMFRCVRCGEIICGACANIGLGPPCETDQPPKALADWADGQEIVK